MPAGDGFHPTWKTFHGKKIRNQGPNSTLLQTYHSHVSTSYSTLIQCRLLIPHLIASWWGRHKKLYLLQCILHGMHVPFSKYLSLVQVWQLAWQSFDMMGWASLISLLVTSCASLKHWWFWILFGCAHVTLHCHKTRVVGSKSL